jgi:uncharacterized protein (DUF1697 family)
MGDLRTLLESMGFERVETLLNSGNAIFDGTAEPDAKLAERIHDAVLKKLKVDAHVVVKSEKDIAAMIAGNKLAKMATDPSRLLVAMTNNANGVKALEAIAKSDLTPDVVHLGKHALYAWCPEGLLDSKSGVALLKNLTDSGTTRNWATIRKIHECMIREEQK